MTADKPIDDETTRPLEMPDESAPVFVDSTGRRGRRIRFAFYGIGGLSLTYAGMVAMSLAGGPLNPETLLPFPDLLINRPAAVDSKPEPAQPERTGSPRPGDGRRGGQNGEAAQGQPGQPGRSDGSAVVAPPGSGIPEGTVAPSAQPSQNPSQPPSAQPSGDPSPSGPQGPTPSGGGPSASNGPTPETGTGGAGGGTGTNTPTGSGTSGPSTGTGTGTGGETSTPVDRPAPTPVEPVAAPPARPAAAPANKRAESVVGPSALPSPLVSGNLLLGSRE